MLKLTCHSIEASIRFYALLGYVPYRSTFELSSEQLLALYGASTGSVRIQQLARAAEPTRAVLELLEWQGQRHSAPSIDQPGNVMAAFSTNSLERDIKNMLAEGAQQVGEVLTATQAGGTLLIVSLMDPNGFTFQLVQMVKAVFSEAAPGR